MPRGVTNAVVSQPLDRKTVREFGFRLKEAATVQCGTMLAFIDDYGMSAPAVYDRLADPDRWTIGQLRELKRALGISKAELIEILRPLL